MTENTVITIAFLSFGAIVLICEFVVLALKKQGFGPQAVRIIGITIVIIVAAGLATSTMSLDRMTPVIGLLGTLGGYLAGRGEGKGEPRDAYAQITTASSLLDSCLFSYGCCAAEVETKGSNRFAVRQIS